LWESMPETYSTAPKSQRPVSTKIDGNAPRLPHGRSRKKGEVANAASTA
jgi:hypothetical protein